MPPDAPVQPPAPPAPPASTPALPSSTPTPAESLARGQRDYQEPLTTAERSSLEPLTAEDGTPLLEVGRLVAAQGLAGELRVLPLSDFPERFTRPGRRWLRAPRGGPRPVELLAGRRLPGKDLHVVRLAGVDSRGAAEALVGHLLLASAAERPRLAPGEFHLLDLEGLEVRLLADGSVIGTVRDLIHGGNDLLEVELREGGRRVLIPFVTAIVPEVQVQAGWIGLTPPPGLLEL